MRFRDLGPLCLESDGLVRPVGGTRLEALLAVLLVRLGQTVEVPTLLEAVWGPRPPHRAAASLDSLLWRLRRLLEPDRTPRAASDLLLTKSHGYRLAIDDRDVDSRRLANTTAAVAADLERGDFAAALEAAERALESWRGRPYDGLSDWDGWQPVQARLDELHLELAQHRIDALLGIGQPERAVVDLLPLLEAHPFRERLWEQRMLGLYRAGRQAAALQVFQEAREVLGAELGLDPGPGLETLQRRILARDQALDGRIVGAVRPAPRRPVRVPRPRSALVGRDEELEKVGALLRPETVVTLTGPVGVGKTRLALALALAEQAATRFPDGRWFVDLSSVAEPSQLAARVAASVGVEVRSDEAAAAALAGFVRDRDVLLVLDNCEHLAPAVAALADDLLADTALAVLATSREPLDVAGEHVWTVAPLAPPPQDSALTDSPAAALFLASLAPRRVTDLSHAERSAVAATCRLTDGLPLALELAAARARVFTLPEVAATLQAHPIALDDPGRRGTRHAGLRAAIEDNHQLATPDERIVHRRLAALPAGFTREAATAVAGLDPLRADGVVDLIAGLAHRSLLVTVPPARPGPPTTFRQLVPIRAHAAEALERANEADRVREARDRWVIDTVAEGPRGGRPGQAQWYDRLDENHPTIHAALTDALVTRADALVRDDAVLTVARLVGYWHDRQRSADASSWLPLVADLARRHLVDPFIGACAFIAHATALALDQHMDTARDGLRVGLDTLPACHPDRRRDAADVLIAAAAGAWVGDDYPLARELAEAARALGETLADPHIVLPARALRAATGLTLDEPDAARAEADDVAAANAAVGNDFASLFVAVTHAIAAALQADPEAGLHWSSTILGIQRRLGVREHADTLEQRGGHHLRAGRPLDAAHCYGAARALHRRVGRRWPRHPGTTQNLARLHDQLGETTYRRALDTGERLSLDPDLETWLP